MDGDAFERSGGDFAADAKGETKPEGNTADFAFGEEKGSDFDAS